MKPIKKLKLIKLNLDELEKREMNSIFGGADGDNTCNCSCSSFNANGATLQANSVHGYQYSYGGNYHGYAQCTCNVNSMQSVRGS